VVQVSGGLYCRRAWWYRSQGVEAENQVELTSGEIFHQKHGAKVITAGLLRLAGWGILLLGITLLTIALTNRWLA